MKNWRHTINRKEHKGFLRKECKVKGIKEVVIS